MLLWSWIYRILSLNIFAERRNATVTTDQVLCATEKHFLVSVIMWNIFEVQNPTQYKQLGSSWWILYALNYHRGMINFRNQIGALPISKLYKFGECPYPFSRTSIVALNYSRSNSATEPMLWVCSTSNHTLSKQKFGCTW